MDGAVLTNRIRLVLLGAQAVLILGLAGCGGNSAPPPQPGDNRGVPPDLRGRRVIVLPVQRVVGVAGNPDAELVFALGDVGREVEWIFEEELQEALTRAPAIQASTRGLPVARFMMAEVERVGDPLYGELRRMAALVDADAVLLPVQVSFEANEAVEGSAPRVRFTVSLIEPRTGRVVWFGIEEGGEFPQRDPRGLASAVERVVRTLLWYVRS